MNQKHIDILLMYFTALSIVLTIMHVHFATEKWRGKYDETKKIEKQQDGKYTFKVYRRGKKQNANSRKLVH